MFKKLFVIIITICLLLVNTYQVNADVLDIGTVATGLNAAFNLNDSNEKKRSDISNWLHQNSDWAGFLFDPVSMSGFLTPSVIWSVLPQSVKDQISDNTDDTEVLNKTIDMILEGQSVSGNNITNNTNVNTFLKNVQNDYVNSNPTIGYTYLLSEIAQRISYADVYNALKSYIADADDIQGNVFVVTLSGLNTQVVKIPNATMIQDSLYVQYGNIATLNGYNYSQGSFYSLNASTPEYSYVQYNNSTKTFVPAGNTMVQNFQLLIDNPDMAIQVGSNQTKFIVSKKYRVGFKIFHSTPTVSDYMYSPYYYNNDVWQDFSTSSGDYTFSPSNINTVTYGDTVTYIDDYNQDHGYPPSIPDININIENENNNNINSGSGSGGDNSGGSGGNGDGIGSIGDIFGWLKQLGSVIASLIKGVGEFATEIIGGIVSAINNLLEGISSIISTVTESIPSVFMQFIEACFDWMPSEWLALLSASLLLMILWGIIKLIRGS